MNFTCCVDNTSYVNKPSSSTIEYTNKFGHTICQSAAISIRIAKHECSVSVTELAQMVGRGQSFTPATFANHRRKKDNFKQSQLIALDFDDGIPETWHAVPSLTYESFSSKPSHIKLRAVWVLDSPVTDRIDYEDMLRGFASLYPTVDMACLEAARLLFGTNKVDSIQTSSTILTSSELLRVPIVKREPMVYTESMSLGSCLAQLYIKDVSHYEEIRNISNKLERDVKRCKKNRYPTLFRTVAWFVATEIWDPDVAFHYIVNVAKKNSNFFTNWGYDFDEVCQSAYNFGITRR